MNISRHKLYAAGEPLGGSVTRKEHGRIVCGCGSDGGDDGGAAEREAARQARVDKATKAVNTLFGVGAKTAMLPTGKKRIAGYGRSLPGGFERNEVGDGHYVNSPLPSGFEQISAKDYAKLAASQRSMYAPVYEDVLAKQQTAAGKNAAARDSLYGQIGADTRDFFSKQLAEDAEEALRQKRFIAARNGTFGSSQNLDMQREFDRRNDRGLLDIANRSAAAMNDVRSADEKSRIDLISRIVGGADQDSATSSARAQLQANADAARTNAMQNRMANVFAGSLDAWRGYNTAQGEADARREFESKYGNFFANNGGYQGTVTR